jgi:membrane protein required for colicin V production
MSALDWVIFLLILFSTFIAIAQGFVKEVLGLAGTLVGYVIAAWEYPKLAAVFERYLTSVWVAEIAAFLAIFLLVVLLAGALARVVNWAISGVGLSWFNRLLGGVFGFVRGIVIGAVLVMAMAAFVPNSPQLEHSFLAPHFLVLSKTATWIAPPELRERFRQGVSILKTAGEKAPPVLPPPSPKKSK